MDKGELKKRIVEIFGPEDHSTSSMFPTDRDAEIDGALGIRVNIPKLQLAKTPKQCWDLLEEESTPRGHQTERQILQKVLDLTTTIEDCRRVFFSSAVGPHSSLGYATIRKMAELIERGVKTPATT